MIKNKKGLEMSIGFVVFFIMSILIFSMAVYLLFQWFGEAEDLGQEIDKRTHEQIVSALRSGNQLVQIPFSVKEVKRGTRAQFGVGVRNIGERRSFRVDTKFSGLAVDPAGKPISVNENFMADNWVGAFGQGVDFTLARSQDEVIPVSIRADVNVDVGVPTPRGDYMFDVCVFDLSKGTAPCTVSSYEANPDQYYTGRMYQVTLRVI